MPRRRSRLLSAFVGACAVALALTSCASGGSPAPTVTVTVTATPTPTPTPTPTETTAPVTLPTDCDELGTEATRQETVGDMTLQSNGEGFVRPAPDGATLVLGCDWIVGEASGVLLLISTADADAVSAAVDGLPAEGYTCQVADDFGAEYCVLPGQNDDSEETIVARDEVWIYMSTVNRNGRAFLSEIVQDIFG